MPRGLAAVPDLDDELRRLYGLPPEQFTPARNDLARRLRQAGQSDAAERVHALKKPSVAVWAVNQLARRYANDVAALIGAGERLRDAQQAAFGGGAADEMRAATATERTAVRTLTHRAQELLEAEGRNASQQTLERIATTLRAAAVDPETARLLAGGRLGDELESPGFAAVAELAPRGAPPRKSRAKSDREDESRRREAKRRKLQARVERLEHRVSEQTERLQRAERAAVQAREQADAVRAELDAARSELDALA